MHAITFLGVVAAFGLLFLSLVAFCAARGFRPFAGVRRSYGRLSVPGRILLFAFVGTLIAYASTKSDGDGGSTNAPPARMMAQRRILVVAPGTVVSEAETDLGYRVLAVRDGNEIVPPGIESVTNAAWRLRGGMMDAFRIGMDPEPTAEDWTLQAGSAWSFPWRAAWTHGLTVFANGEFQPSVRDDFFPRPFGPNLSLVPQAKWGAIADGSLESLFWHELTPSNSLVLTWQNALYGRDANAPTNFQAELFGDGSFDYRYPDRTVSYAPVFPFDWDGDGLENSVDPEPRVAGPDAHGTNAEWYNNVCSNVFVAVEGADGLTLAPRHADVNTNAYYFVDVVAERGPAPIYFTADGESDLGNPIVIAQAGVTNRVPLLIGPEYVVTSSVPLIVTCSREAVCVDSANLNGFSVRWPVFFSFSFFGSGGSSYWVDVEPSCLGGEFSWTDGCCVSSLSNVVSFSCGGDCSCSGCAAGGMYNYCGTSLAFAGGNCGCNEHGVGHVGSDGVVPDLAVSMALDNNVILFENTYTNKPNEVVSRRSTFSKVQLSILNSSGASARALFFPSGGGDRIILHEDGTNGIVVSSWSTNLLSGTSVRKTFYVEGTQRSSTSQDVELRGGLFAENGGAGVVNRKMTVSEVVVEADADFPPVKNRHVFGVGETAVISVNPCPQNCEIRGTVGNGGTNDVRGTESNLTCPYRAQDFMLEIVASGTSMPMAFEVVEPLGELKIDGERYPTQDEWDNDIGGDAFKVGDIGSAFHVDLALRPDYVSFEMIWVVERFAPAVDIWGMFTNAVFRGKLNHGIAQGAGRERRIGECNTIGTGDNITFGLNRQAVTSLSDGGFSLQIPLDWAVSGSSETNRLGVFTHVNTVYSNGTAKVEKHWVSAVRGTNEVSATVRRMK